MTAVLNTPSQAVMRRIGMTEATRFEHPGVPDGSPVRPHVMYHLAASRDRAGESLAGPPARGGRRVAGVSPLSVLINACY